MQTKMAFPIRFWGTLLILLLLYQFSTVVGSVYVKHVGNGATIEAVSSGDNQLANTDGIGW